MKNPGLDRTLLAPHKVFFSWYLNNECNYKCSYCKPQDIDTIFISVDKWIEIWNQIYNEYGSCHIHISGGEPFIYPNFIELIKRLSEKHTLEFSTNLSCDITPFINNISPDRVRLGGSFHPEFADFDDFLNNISLLKDRGFDVWINYVAYPLHLKDMEKYKKATEAKDIHFAILPFSGEFSGRDYPQNYTEEEKKLMAFGDIGPVNKDIIDWRIDKGKSSIRGELCRMGQMYARVYPNADAFRCCGNGVLKLGNLADGTFKLLNEPMPCECDNCPCHKCMIIGKEEHWQGFWIYPGNRNK